MNRNVFKKRVIITGILFMGIACFFIFRFTRLLLTEKIKLASEINTKIRRGCIKDSRGYTLAMSVESESLFANPGEIENPDETAKRLSTILGYSVENTAARLKKEKQFVWLKRKMNSEETENVRSLGIKGLYFKKELKRIYPHDRLASNILGFVDTDNNGIEGMEFMYDKVLKGIDRTTIFQNPRGIDERTLIEGKNIVLTIDKFIQHISEEQLRNTVTEFDAHQGVAAVLEVKTGRILAIAKYPGFNPNYYYRFSAGERGNFGIVNSFEPGSTFKIIALAAIMEYKPDAMNAAYICDGSVDIGDATIKCGRAHGRVNINDIIRHSCNVGIIKAMDGVPKKDFYSLIQKFGFGETLGIELPGESRGILRPVEKWSGLSKYSISIGQEISVTTLQLAAALSAIGNGGVYLNPKIIESIERPDGTVEQSFFPSSKGSIIKRAEAARLIKMMRDVVLSGTGERAESGYYTAAGKTGTAQKVMPRGGYSPDRFVASFIGLAPAEDPDVCILVVIDEPRGTNAGGEVAAPAFAGIAQRILPYRGIKQKTIAGADPLKIQKRKIEFDGRRVPDFYGLSVRQSLELCIAMQKKYDFTYNFIGSGAVYSQSPAPGAELAGNKKLFLFLKEPQ